jgi:hypothetical protein
MLRYYKAIKVICLAGQNHKKKKKKKKKKKAGNRTTLSCTS